MNQIAIGDPIKGFIILHGQSIAVPNLRATANLNYSSEPYIRESLAIELRGTPGQVAAAIAKLEVIIQRAVLYEQIAYASPQYLRFQLTAGGDYYYTPISDVYLSSNPAGYITQQKGSKVIYFYYTRPNWFDGDQTQVPLSGRAGTFNPPNAYPLRNHTDSGVGDGSTVLVDKAHFSTVLPAPIRFQYEFNSAGEDLKDLFTGVYHHPTYNADGQFFAYYGDLSGGIQVAHSSAIEGNFKRFQWSSFNWLSVTSHLIDPVTNFDGRSYRPFYHFFSPPSYTDLYLRVQIERGGTVLHISDPVYCEPNTGYAIFPPIEIPPNYLLRETSSARVSCVLYGRRLSGAATTLEIDCLTYMPLMSSATFYGFANMTYPHTLVDDSHRERHNVWIGIGASETVMQMRAGSPLMLFPNDHCRIFYYCVDPNDIVNIAVEALLKVFYRPRLRLL